MQPRSVSGTQDIVIVVAVSTSNSPKRSVSNSDSSAFLREKKNLKMHSLGTLLLVVSLLLGVASADGVTAYVVDETPSPPFYNPWKPVSECAQACPHGRFRLRCVVECASKFPYWDGPPPKKSQQRHRH
ncbi:hypothetical protein Y032_0726g1863 [Ancylostoma ceylanicum]|uniref:Uncharacterized protein n=1 Tax=Ancylostoma ceylanicum TaxID=53326 RepID=A0A016WF79_9BILA|nr:hypothetical protein Y032_0726g1863 [Ancylostoma ceylanicum]